MTLSVQLFRCALSIDGALHAGFAWSVVSFDVTNTYQLPSLNDYNERFAATMKGFDLAQHVPIVHVFRV